MSFLLCGPCWYVHKPDVQNQWDDNKHTQRDRAEGRLVALYIIFLISFSTCTSHMSDYVAKNKVVYYFHVNCIQNLLQMVTAHGFLHDRGAGVQLVGRPVVFVSF